MRARLQAVLSSLELRLLVPLILTVAGVLAVHALVGFRATEGDFLELAGAEADRSSGLIRRATHDGMLLNDMGAVQATIERLSEGAEIAAIRVYDKDGRIAYSSERGEIGRSAPLESTPCSDCHSEEGPTGDALRQAQGLMRSDGAEVLRHLSVIEGGPACSSGGCHADATGQSVLGVLDVEMSMVPLERALASSRRQLVWTTAVLVLVIALVATLIFRVLVRRPIALLKEGARRIAAGELSTRIDVPGEHDLAILSRDFNRMAEDLSRSQSQLTEWSQTLEQKVHAKTEELQAAQRQVLLMEKMASLGKLSATVAHELNNPLSGVLTYARLVERELADQPLDSQVRAELERYMHLVQRECVRCGDIVQNLLAFARRTPGETASVDLGDVVDRSVMLVRHHLEIRGITLQTRIAEGSTTIEADAGQLQQALVALLVNAVEAMPEGGELHVTLAPEKHGVVIDIHDTGVGIPPDVLPQIFEPFFSTKGDESGVGLGLAVVYGIVHRHGGSIEVESDPGVGTVFHVRLPRIPPARARDDAETEAAAAPVGTLAG